MADEATDVKDAQVVDEQAAGAEDQQAVSQTDTGAGVKDGQVAADAGAEQAVPYSRFKEVNDAKNAQEEENVSLRAQNQVLTQQVAVVPQQPQKQPTLYEQTLTNLGYQDSSYLTTEQQGQVFNQMFQAISVSQADDAFVQAHPDFTEVVGTSNATGRFIPAAPLQRVLAKDPHLGPALWNSPQGKRLAYQMAVNDPEYQTSLKEKGLSPEVKAAADAKAVIAAANKQASISEAGTGQGNLDKAAVIANMSDEEFEAYKEKIKAKAS